VFHKCSVRGYRIFLVFDLSVSRQLVSTALCVVELTRKVSSLRPLPTCSEAHSESSPNLLRQRSDSCRMANPFHFTVMSESALHRSIIPSMEYAFRGSCLLSFLRNGSRTQTFLIAAIARCGEFVSALREWSAGGSEIPRQGLEPRFSSWNSLLHRQHRVP
jgi:hypothetical protein